MDVANCLYMKLDQILSRLKFLRVIRSYTLRVDFGEIDEDFKNCLQEIDNLLKKCLEKINSKPRRAEIRNVISELVRKKNTEKTQIKLGFPKGNLPCRSRLDDTTKSLFNKEQNASCRLRCMHCDQRFKNKNNLIAHLSTHQKVDEYLCEFCGVILESFSNYQFHLFQNHSPTSNLKLEKCFQSYPSKEEMENHSEIHAALLCQKQFTVDSSREKVPTTIVLDFLPLRPITTCKKSDNESSSNAFSVKKCQNEGDIRCHYFDRGAKESENSMRGEAQKKDKFSKSISVSCGECGRIFGRVKSLQKHINLKHSNAVKKFSCDICEKSFFERGKLNRHIRIHETGNLKCSHCNKTFCRMDNLRRHFQLSHANVQPYECKFCQKKFSLKHNRDVHEENIHNGMEIQCELCGQKCKNKGTFRLHQKVHEDNAFSCTLCSKTYKRKEKYRSHWKNKHKGISPFQKLFDTFVKGDLDGLPDAAN